MKLEKKLEREVQDRVTQIAARFASPQCAGCTTVSGIGVVLVAFRWRKQIGRSADDHVRVEHVSELSVCRSCFNELQRRRPYFWLLRYAGGIALAVSLCGTIASPILLALLRATPGERRSLWLLGTVSLCLLPASLLALRLARQFSVPHALLKFTGRGWECISIDEKVSKDSNAETKPQVL